MKFFKLLIIFQIVLFFNSCSTMKEGFSNQKKDNTDEFLVKKKSPLVMPPEFNELPTPNNQNHNNNKKQNSIKNMISEKKSSKDNNIANKDLEGSILDKIKTD